MIFMHSLIFKMMKYVKGCNLHGRNGGGAPRHVPPLEGFWGGTAPPKKIYKKEKIYKKWSKKSIKKEKIYKKWSKNASREVQKSKIF